MLKKPMMLTAIVASIAACSSVQIPDVEPAWIQPAAEEQAQSQAPGLEATEMVYHGLATREQPFQEWMVELQKGQCYWFSGVSDKTLSELGLYLWNSDRKRRATQKSRTNKVVMAHCAEQSGMYKLQGKSLEGVGHFVVSVFEKAAPEADPIDVEVTAPQEAEVEASQTGWDEIVDTEAAVVAPEAARVGEIFIGTGKVGEWSTVLEEGVCYWLVAVGEDEVKELSLYLWNDAKKRVAQNTRTETNKSSLGYCAKEKGMHRFQAKVASGKGNYGVGLYRK